MNKTIADEFEDLNLIELFNLKMHIYPDKPEIIKSSKNKDAVLYEGHYYNHLRSNKHSEYFKCRTVIDEKECSGSFTLNKDGTFKVTSHKHRPMAPIECDIKKIRNEMDFFISSNPTSSVAKQWEKKIIELSLKYSEREVAIFCPEFNQVDSAFFTKKAKLVPKLPQL